MSNVSNAVDIAASHTHVCILQMDGDVKCTGDNKFGALGDGTTVTRYEPVTVLQLANASQVVTGRYSTCATLRDGDGGGVKCWGFQFFGQLGTGNTTPDSVFSPTSVVNFESTKIASLSAGFYHTCLVSAMSGAVFCTGLNTHQQIGDSAMGETRAVMSQVTGLESGVASVSCSGHSSCALLASTGEVRCWGFTSFDLQVGGQHRATALGSGVASLWNGFTTLCVTYYEQNTTCLGKNIEQSNATSFTKPFLLVGGKSDIKEVRFGYESMCFLDELGAVECAAYFNTDGQLGRGDELDASGFALVYGITRPPTVPTSSPTNATSPVGESAQEVDALFVAAIATPLSMFALLSATYTVMFLGGAEGVIQALLFVAFIPVAIGQFILQGFLHLASLLGGVGEKLVSGAHAMKDAAKRCMERKDAEEENAVEIIAPWSAYYPEARSATKSASVDPGGFRLPMLSPSMDSSSRNSSGGGATAVVRKRPIPQFAREFDLQEQMPLRNMVEMPSLQ